MPIPITILCLVLRFFPSVGFTHTVAETHQRLGEMHVLDDDIIRDLEIDMCEVPDTDDAVGDQTAAILTLDAFTTSSIFSIGSTSTSPTRVPMTVGS